jgi:AhpD family alkylhydroperoxidase
MDSKLAPQAEAREATSEPEVPVSNPREKNDGKPASYSMMEPKMRQIYGAFYREIYFSEKKHLDTKTQELISIAASLVAKCQGCIDGHLKKALQAGASPEEISETISIAAAINAASIIDLTDTAAANLNINHFPSDGPRFRG